MPEQEMNIEEIKKQCIFCHIISGRVASKKIYENQQVSATLDINPANPGHTLLLPKEHYSIMPQIPDEEIGYTGMTAKAISSALLRALKAHSTTIFIANGIAAGQRAQHFMTHIIPRMENDGLGIELPERKISQEKLNEIRNLLLPAVKKTLGTSAEPSTENKKETEKEAPKEDKKEQTKYGKQEKKEEDNKETKKKTEEADLDEIARLLGK